MSWNEVIAIEPALAPLEEYLKPVPLSKQDREYYERFKKTLSDEQFAKLTYEEKDKYLDI